MADEPPKPDPEHLARFRRVMTAVVAVPKDEAFRAFLKKELKTPKRLDSKGSIKAAYTGAQEILAPDFL